MNSFTHGGTGQAAPAGPSYLHKELAAAMAQQLVQPHLHIKGRPLPADIQVLSRQGPTDHHFSVGTWHSRLLSKAEAHVGNVLSGSHA